MRSLGLLLLLPLAFVLYACRQPDASVPAEEPFYLNTAPGVEYVGKETCQTCHAEQYDTFVQSQMGRSFRPAVAAESQAEWEEVEPIYDPHNDLYYEPERRSEDLFIVEYRLAGRDTVHKRVEQIDYIVGSGHHTNSHIREENGYLYQIPLTWYVQEGIWDLPPGFKGGGRRFDRTIQLECMTCHNARPTFVEGSENRFAEVPHGIDCEQCHGPGQLHVEGIMAGEVVDITQEADRRIVNPRRLSPERQLDVCQRCHNQGTAVLQDGQSFLDFRPSQRLDEVMVSFQPRYTDSTEHFIMASHPDRLSLSACFEASWEPGSTYEPMTCINCHDPHLSIEEQAAELTFNTVCQDCHTPSDAGLCTEEEAARAAVGDDCAQCHMPSSPTLDIPHVQITDHYIRPLRSSTTPGDGQGHDAGEAPPVRETFVRMAQLYGDPADPLMRAQGFLAHYEQYEHRPQFLDSAAVLLAQAADQHAPAAMAPARIRLHFLQEAYAEVTSIAASVGAEVLTDAWTLYRVGEAYRKRGQLPAARRYLEQAVEEAPEQLSFLSKLAGVYAEGGQAREALMLYDRILAADPTYTSAYNDRGFLRAMMGRFDEAEADLRQAVALDPDGLEALGNLASLYVNTQRLDEARPVAERLLELDPDNPAYRQLWTFIENGP